MISEAAPWSDPEKQVAYFYTGLQGAWCGRVINSILRQRPTTVEETLQQLANSGFLLIDTLPFACSYNAALRNSAQYKKLVAECLPYFSGKLKNSDIVWHDDVRVALAFKINALQFIEQIAYRLELPNGQCVHLNEKLIAADGSGYTNPTFLQRIWGE